VCEKKEGFLKNINGKWEEERDGAKRERTNEIKRKRRKKIKRERENEREREREREEIRRRRRRKRRSGGVKEENMERKRKREREMWKKIDGKNIWSHRRNSYLRSWLNMDVIPSKGRAKI